MRRASVIVFLLAGACGRPPVEAPADLADLGLFLFQHFDDEDPAEMHAGILQLQTYILGLDLTLDPKESAVTMPILEGASLDGLAIPEGVPASEQVPVALSGLSVHTLDDQLALVFEPNQVCIESDTTVWAERTFLSDEGCFADASCVELNVSQEVFKQNALAKVWYDQFKNYRWYDYTDDEGNAGRAMIGRSWIEEKFVGSATLPGEASWDQLFHLDVSIENPEDPATALRWFSLWSSVHIPGIGPSDYAALVKDGIAQALSFGDSFISEEAYDEYCGLDRDAEKPPRDE